MTHLVDENLPDDEIKSCCARLYELDIVRVLFGGSYHPGGLDLTTELAGRAGIQRTTRVLDVASGTGASALHLARTLGCEVVGVDYGSGNVQRGNRAARAAGLAGRVRFERGDSERLPVEDGAFDVVLCECAFCTFPEKARAAAEFARVLVEGGRVAFSDVTRARNLPPELGTVMAWAACIADAQSLAAYSTILSGAGFAITDAQQTDHILREMLTEIRTRLLGLEIASALGKLDSGNLDFKSGRTMARAAEAAINEGTLGYGLLIAEKRSGTDT